jgi:hypothetical protein
MFVSVWVVVVLVGGGGDLRCVLGGGHLIILCVDVWIYTLSYVDIIRHVLMFVCLMVQGVGDGFLCWDIPV